MSELTLTQKWLSRKYIAYEFLTNLYFTGAVWLYFYRIFITDQQVGIIDALAFAIGLVAEVPSGALADRFGRDRMVKLGQFLAGAGLIIQAFGHSMLPFIVGQTVFVIGIAFVSGADEALFFQKLKFDKNSIHWRKLVTRGAQWARVGSIGALLIGALSHSINPSLPWVFTGVSFIIAVFVVWNIKDERVLDIKHKVGVKMKDHLFDIKSGFAQFFTPKLWLYVPIIVIVQGVFYTTGWGVLRLILLDRFHFSTFVGSIVIASCSLLTIGALALLHKFAEKFSERRMLVSISLVTGAGLLISVFNIGAWGYFVLLVLYLGEHIMYPFMSEVFNNRAEENQRATVLSVASFLKALPYVALGPIIGYLNTNNKLEYFLITWAVLIVVAVIIYLSLKKKDAVIDMTEDVIEEEPRVPEIGV